MAACSAAAVSVTKVPRPAAVVTTPSASSVESASRKEVRLTASSDASSRCAGRRSPGFSALRRIRSWIARTAISGVESLSRIPVLKARSEPGRGISGSNLGLLGVALRACRTGREASPFERFPPGFLEFAATALTRPRATLVPFPHLP